MPTPDTHYARTGDVEIAYQTIGDGPVDLVWAFGLMTHLEVKWEEPSLAAMLHELSRFARVIMFDRRGCGLSDRGDRHLAPTLQERVEDVVAVLDAVGSERASLFGVSEGCALATLFASMHPGRTERVILYGGISRLLRDEDHPWGVLDADLYDAAFGPVFEHWGTREGALAQVRLIAPSAAEDEDYLAWFARQQRLSLSRDAVVRFMGTVTTYDVEAVLPTVRAPTLVLHREDDTIIPLGSALRVASRIPGAEVVELPGSDHLPYLGDAGAVVDAVRTFLGVPAPEPGDRRLVTLLAADAPDAVAATLVRRHLRRWGATEVEGPPGVAAGCFDSATRALRCALGLLDAGEEQGLDLRAAVHTGECAIDGGRVSGPAARVTPALLDHTGPGRAVATRTVREVVPGSGVEFARGSRVRLPGSLGEVEVSEVVRPGAVAPPTPGPEQVFRRDGEYWTVAFEGRVVTLRDTKGMRDLAALLAQPGRERHVLDLASGEGGVAVTRQPVLDAEAHRRYRARLAELDVDLAGAEAAGSATAELAEERDWLVRELAAAYGVGGRGRAMTDDAERARKAVYRRVRDALARIEDAHPRLGRHLRHSVHTGVYCSYAPERDLRWTTG